MTETKPWVAQHNDAWHWKASGTEGIWNILQMLMLCFGLMTYIDSACPGQPMIPLYMVGSRSGHQLTLFFSFESLEN